MVQLYQQIAIRDVAVSGKNETSCDETFASLVNRQSRFAFRVAYSILRNTQDSEDAMQETFFRLYRSRAWETMEDEKAFIARVAWRVAIDRRRKTHAALPSPPFEFPANTENPEQSAIAADRKQALNRMIEALPDELRQPLVLSTIDELTSQQIASVLGIPEGTVRSRASRARQLLKQKLSAFIGGSHE
jgi:RNA polymerase sigma-70 factor (ECF subfamily)